MNSDDIYMRRCFQLARLGIGNTRTNPLVGAVLVHQNVIIGEGYHSAFGAPHAEIEALKNVQTHDLEIIENSTLYVNLEPCCIHGKTPPCVDEIIRRKIKKVVVGQVDPNPKINGKGLKILEANHVQVVLSGLEAEAKNLNKVFNKNMNTNLPYITLKFACSSDGYLGRSDQRVKISNSWSEYLVHKIRHQVDGILIGTNTAKIDNPSLTNRLYYGKNPVRIIMDRSGSIPPGYHLFNDGFSTWLLTENEINGYKPNVRIMSWVDDLTILMKNLLQAGLSSILVEGGAKTLNSFIETNLWDELWCTQSKSPLHHGVPSPKIKAGVGWTTNIGTDELRVYYNDRN